ncbi:MAG: alanine--tRNA ligase, partial [Candidatus Magasanikbacteria bacterium]
MLTSVQLRQKYLEFFKIKGHAIIASASLIPNNDPSVLFTTAGMHPLVPYLLGQKHPAGKRLANAQKCVRTGDIDETGDNRHLTFFEMLGNWSLGDYFKEEAIRWSWEFLTSPEWLRLDKRKIAVSVFAGDKEMGIPQDDEAANIWKSAGVPEERIAYLGKDNNWWPAGGKMPGPQGPDTEMFYWAGEAELPPPGSNPGNDEESWLEIWNDVFMQFNKSADGEYVQLEQKNVDTGMGLERTLKVLNGYADVFQTDTFWPLIESIQGMCQHSYIEGGKTTKAMRIIADHLRTATFIMGDDSGITPSNTDQGYIVRRLIRRAVRYGRMLNIKGDFTVAIAKKIIEIFKDAYPELNRNKEFIFNELAGEENKFTNTVEQGLKEFEKLLNSYRVSFEKTGNVIKEISGKHAFKLYDTYGFP